jgi:2-amino-4-hydroxy-6-hydroxymethyldihydropteridine diphosphokinase
MPSAERAYIGLGANLSDRLRCLQRAVKHLDDSHRIQVEAVSSVYETAPVGPQAQDWFLNAVVAINTGLDPVSLLSQTQAIEQALGRKPTYHWGPRSIDVDILLYGNVQLMTGSLTIPHPELCRRAFVLVPLLELASGLVLPDGTPISACLAGLSPAQEMRLFAPAAALSWL